MAGADGLRVGVLAGCEHPFVSFGDRPSAPGDRPRPPRSGRPRSVGGGRGAGAAAGVLRRLGEPRPARVQVDRAGRPLAVDGERVEAVVETWLLDDRWWADDPLLRRMWEVVTVRGRAVVVFCDLTRWPRQWWRLR